MSQQSRFIDHVRSLVLSSCELPPYSAFVKSLSDADRESLKGVFKSMESISDLDLIFDTDVDRFAQMYIDLAGKSQPRIIITDTTEEPKVKSEPKVKTKWSSTVDKFIETAEIDDEEVINALRGADVCECYKNKQHCYVVLACRCKLLAMWHDTNRSELRNWALVKANKKTLDSIKRVDYFNASKYL